MFQDVTGEFEETKFAKTLSFGNGAAVFVKAADRLGFTEMLFLVASNCTVIHKYLLNNAKCT